MADPPSQRQTPPEEVRRARDELEVILGGVAEAILARDAKGRITYANRAAIRLFGYDSRETLLAAAASGDIFTQFAMLDEHGAPLPEERHPHRLALAGQPSQDLTVRLRDLATKQEHWFLVSSSPVLGDDGKPHVVISIWRDITERKRAEEALRVRDEWFATTLKSIGDGVIATDEMGRVTFMNAVAEELTGWRINEAKGHDLDAIFRIVNETTRAVVESPVTKVIREGVVVGLANHTILIKKDASEIAIDDSGAPIRSAQNQLVGVVLVFRDVTAKRQEEERRLFIAEASGVLASSLDYATTLTTVARLAVPHVADWCVVDICEDDGECRTVASHHVVEAKVKAASELQRAYPARKDDPHGVALVVRTGKAHVLYELPDGYIASIARDAEHRRMLEALGLTSLIVLPLRARGRTLGTITFAYADSGRHYDDETFAFAQQLCNAAALAVDNARLYAEANDANRLKDEFLATLSHELRTPLNAMLGWTRMLRSGSLAAERADHALSTVERNAQAQARLIDDLLDVSRIITGKLRLDVRSVDLAPVVDAAIDAHRPAADAKSIRVDVTIDRMIEPIAGDANRIQQIIWNLLSNAVKFTPKGGRISIGVARVDSRVEIVVSDTGSGIDAEFLPFVFDRFRQADSHGTKMHTGLGLGLSIVRHLVEAHGGTVRAESDGKSKGAKFTVSFPLPALNRGGADVVASYGNAPLHLADLKGLRVLVVDDDDDSRELLATVLEEAGAVVRSAASAREGLDVFTEHRPDVIVSDIGMPGEDGYAFIRRIRALPPEQGGNVPATALTAYARAEDRTNAILAGFQSHVPKPVEPDELAAVVAALAGRAQRSGS